VPAATVKIKRATGTAPTYTDITNLNTRASTSDNPYTNETTNPIPIPTDAATKRSYWATEYLYVDDWGTSATINNLKFYTDGASNLGLGVSVLGNDASSYVQASGTEGVSGNELSQANHVGLTAAPVDLFSFIAGGPKAIGGSRGSGEGAGPIGNAMVWQMNIINMASPGACPAEAVTWVYDEV